MSMFFGMENKDVIMTAAVIVGPILAVHPKDIRTISREKKKSLTYFQNSYVNTGPKTTQRPCSSSQYD